MQFWGSTSIQDSLKSVFNEFRRKPSLAASEAFPLNLGSHSHLLNGLFLPVVDKTLTPSPWTTLKWNTPLKFSD